jgi:hypothetical protein
MSNVLLCAKGKSTYIRFSIGIPTVDTPLAENMETKFKTMVWRKSKFMENAEEAYRIEYALPTRKCSKYDCCV